MVRLLLAALALIVTVAPLTADEFTETLDSALRAYREGDFKGAGEDLGFATKLLSSQRSATLAKFLPEALAGWTRTLDDSEDAIIGMAIFGGGTTASATYSDGKDDIKLTLLADSPMVSGMGAMLSGMAGLTGGTPLRIKRVEFAQSEGEMQGLVGDKVMVSAAGTASVEQKSALIEAIDLDALADF